ncbi:MAG: DedA family protein [Leptospiraceae bacterium]|nr:DedA family protein [Leptospiraceae bacterium]
MEILTALISFFQSYGYFAVFGVLVLCGFGLPVPEDITLISGGVISALGKTNEHVMFLVGMIGVLFGDSAVYLLGLWKGESIKENRFVKKLLTEERYLKVESQFEKYGKWVVFMARFMPGLRMPIYLTAGITKKVSFTRFLLTDFFAALISVPIWVYLGFYLAHNFDLLMEYVHNVQAVIFTILGLVVLFFIVKYFMKKKERE